MNNIFSDIINREKGNLNTLIKESGIDRSTFFKIKRGERVPTEKQFISIVGSLTVSQKEKRQMIEEFEFHRYWQSQNEQSFSIVREFLRTLNDISLLSGSWRTEKNTLENKNNCKKEIFEFLKKGINRNIDGKIRILFPPDLLSLNTWEEVAGIINQNQREWNVTLLLKNRGEELYDPVRKLHHVQNYLKFLKETGSKISVFRDVTITDFSVDAPYPYWILFRDSMLLIEKDLKECIEIQKKSVISNFSEVYENRVAKSYPILKKYDHLEKVIQDLSEKCDQVATNGNRFYVMSSIPSTIMYVQEKQILDYCTEEMAALLIGYKRHFCPVVTCEFATVSGYRRIQKERIIPEWNIPCYYSESELTVFEENIRNRVSDHRMFFLSEDSGYIPDDFSIFLFEDLEINIQSFSDPDYFIQIREKELVEPLQKWFRYRDKIAEIEKALGMVEDPFSIV